MNNLYNILIGVVLLIISLYFVKKIVKFIFFTVTPMFLSISLDIPYSKTILIVFLVSFMIKDLYKKLKLLLKFIFSPAGKYYSCGLEKIASIVFELNYFLLHIFLDLMLISNIIQNLNMAYIIQEIIIFTAILSILKFVRKITYKLVLRNRKEYL